MNFSEAIQALQNNKTISRNNFEFRIKFFPAISEYVLFVKFTKLDGSIESFWTSYDDASFSYNDILANDWIIEDEI